jgi:hypothetical protein
MPRGIPNPDPTMYGITRLIQGYGWYVFLRRRGRPYSAEFRDRHYGGRQGSLGAAKAYRDRLVCEKEPLSKREFAMIVRSTNTSGIPGVRRIRKASGHIYWIAETKLPAGKSLHRTFSAGLLGEEEARRSAIEERQRQLESVTGLVLFNSMATVSAEAANRKGGRRGVPVGANPRG